MFESIKRLYITATISCVYSLIFIFYQLSDLWLDAAYLDYRSPVVVNVSPSVLFPQYDFRGAKGQVEHAAKLIAGVLDYKIDIDK